MTVQQLEQDVSHDYYVEALAHLVVEVILPEQREVDDQIRRAIYEQDQVTQLILRG